MPESTPPCRDCVKCDDKNSITSFPVDLDSEPTESIYDSVNEPLSINFQWATRSTPPTFTTPGKGLIDEGSTSGATNVSTFRYKGVRYNIQSVQIADATHNNWVIPSTVRTLNTEDIIITFYTSDSSTQYRYIVIIIPIIRNGSSGNDPNYLTALSTRTITNGTFSLSSCLPNSKKAQFAYYSTCLDGYSEKKNPENIYVFIAVNGIPVSATTANALRNRITPSTNGSGLRRGLRPSARDAFAAAAKDGAGADVAKAACDVLDDKTGGALTVIPYDLPFTVRLTSKTQTVLTSSDFSKYILTTRDLLDFSGIGSIYKDLSTGERTDKVDEYQCVPLDPDTDIIDGQIKIDLENGTVLSKILEEREAVRSLSAPKELTKDSKNRLEKYLGSALGIICAIIIFSILLYFIFTYASSKMTPAAAVAAATTAATTATTPITTDKVNEWVKQLPLYGIMVIVAGLIGFTVGTTLK